MIRVTQMLLFSIFNSAFFGSLNDSSIYQFDKNKINEIQNMILDGMLDKNDNLFSIQNISRVANELYQCEVGKFYSPIIVMYCIIAIFEENQEKR